MQILSAEQLRLWDQYTIREEPIPSIELMERAANACLDWLEEEEMLDRSYSIFCGKGNNGGDGLALARLLSQREVHVLVYILEFGHKGTDDFQINLARLHQTEVEIRFIQSEETLPVIAEDDVVIDALFGSGLNRPLEGVTAKLIELINQSTNEIIAIDIPSGMYVGKSSAGNPMIRATHTLSFQCYKPAFLFAENEDWVGDLHVLDIGLDPGFLNNKSFELELVDMDFIRALIKPRKKFAHKGNFGHALLVAGSYGKMGAAVLTARACLQSGAGLVTCHIPKSGYTILQTAIPEAMVETDANEMVSSMIKSDLSRFKVIGIGPGLGQEEITRKMLGKLLQEFRSPMVIDADALNILATQPNWIDRLPPYSILTPHPREFERLFGKTANDFDRMASARENSKLHQCIIVLKGHYTFIALPGGAGYFNSTGNAGMAKGGTGDALTGIITGFLSQGYLPAEAAILGVFIHGLAGDLAAAIHSEESLLAGDLIDCLGKAFLAIHAGR